MSRAKRLHSVMSLAHQRERDAAQKLGQAQQVLNAEKQKLEQMHIYRKEYSDRFCQLERSSLPSARITSFHAFIASIDLSITQQHHFIEQAAGQIEAVKTNWQSANRRFKALEKVYQRIRDEEKKLAQSAEQREQDDRPIRKSGFDT